MVSGPSIEREVLSEPAERDRDTVDLRGVFSILRERWAYVAIPTAIALALALLYLAAATRTYTGVTSLLIDTRTRPAVGDPNNSVGFSPDAILVESQVRLISSDAVLRRVVESEALADDPEFAPVRPGLRARIMQALGLGGKSASAEDRNAQAAFNLATRVVVKRSERTYIADIEVTSADPMKAAHLSDAVAKAYLADQQAARNDAAERDSDWVRGQIQEMQASLQTAELKAEGYKRQHGLIGANGKLLNEQELADTSASLSQAQSRATEVKARLDQIKNVNAAGRNLDTLPDALKSPLIDKLRGQYADLSRQQATLRQTLGDRHPALLEAQQQLRDIRRLIIEELARIQAGIANEFQTAQASVASLQIQVAALKDAAGISNENRVRLDELQRDVDARRTVYDRFLRARDTVREQAIDAPIGRIVAPARIPTSPTSPKSFAVLALSLAAGLGLGVTAALARDLMTPQRDQAPREPATASVAAVEPQPVVPVHEEPLIKEDAPLLVTEALPIKKEVFAVQVLGFVPSPFGNAATLTARSWLIDRLRTAWPMTMDTEHVPSLPAFRTSIAALGLMDPGATRDRANPRTILVTSLAGCDSRTTLALGLAEAAAAQGKHAIVIDADEHGSLLRDIVIDTAKPALIDLMGTTRLCYRIAAPFRGSLSVVPIIPGEGHMARRLQKQGTTTRIDGVSSNYDTVIFDGPSFGQSDRLRAMAATVETVVLVTGKGATQDSVEAAVAALALPRDTNVAAVLAADLTEGSATSAAA